MKRCSVENSKKLEGKLGLYEMHLGLLTGTYKPPTFLQRLEDRGPFFRCWFKQRVNSFDSLELSQAILKRGG